MNKAILALGALVVGGTIGFLAGGRQVSSPPAPEAAMPVLSAFSAVPGAIGGEDVSGPYDVVEGWPQDLATLPGHEKWTYGGARGIFAESPNRVFLLGGGELPNIPRPEPRLLTDIGPNVLSGERPALAQRQCRDTARRRRLRARSRARNGSMARRRPALPRARRRCTLGALHRRGQR